MYNDKNQYNQYFNQYIYHYNNSILNYNKKLHHNNLANYYEQLLNQLNIDYQNQDYYNQNQDYYNQNQDYYNQKQQNQELFHYYQTNEIYHNNEMFNLNNEMFNFNNNHLKGTFENYLNMDSNNPVNFHSPVNFDKDNNNENDENDEFLNELLEFYKDANYKENIKKKQKIYYELDVKASSLYDLIEITNKYSYNEDYNYNIDLEGLHKIKDDLIELNNLIGLDKIKKSIFEQIIYFIQKLHLTKNEKDGDFKHTVIYGPPGTGKTLIAKILGKIYSKIGILKNNYFKSITRSDLIAGYLGQTAIKTKKVIQEALGGVLFIDEAYSLGGENSDNFSKECLDTLCHELSEYKNELMVIIAGYENELNDFFFSKNKGLDSRFIWRFEISGYNYKELMNIFLKKINDIDWSLDENNKINDDWFKVKMPYFTNYGRDMEILLLKTKIVHSKRVFGKKELLKKISIDDINKGFQLFKENPEVIKRNERKEIPGLYT